MEILTGSEHSLASVTVYREWPRRLCSGHMIAASSGDTLLLSETVK